MEENQKPVEELKKPESVIHKGIKKYLFLAWEFLEIIIIAAAIVLPIRYFLFQPFIVKGDSMVPNFQSGDYLIVDEISYRFGSPERGDVVVFRYPVDPTQRFIKRTIGLPGETVDVQNGKVTIYQGSKALILDEKKYLPETLTTHGSVHITLKNDEYFVMGDNREFSYDSRSWGALSRKDIIGKALFRLLPINTILYIADPSY